MAELTVKLPEELDRRLREEAARTGKGLDELVLGWLAERLRDPVEPMAAQLAAQDEMLRKGIITAPVVGAAASLADPPTPAFFHGPPVSQTLVEDRR